MKILLIAILTLIPSISLACTLDEATFDKTRDKFDQLDKNGDGRLEKAEFLAQKTSKPKKLESEWKSAKPKDRDYLTKDEYVARAHPKCIEVKK